MASANVFKCTRKTFDVFEVLQKFSELIHEEDVNIVTVRRLLGCRQGNV